MIRLALPKGRILKDALPILEKAGLKPEPAFFDDKDRRLTFKTNQEGVEIIRVKSFDVATFVAFQGADMGVCGYDVMAEFSYEELYCPVDLKIGGCRLSLAAKENFNFKDFPCLKVATKYPRIAEPWFQRHSVQTHIIQLNGAIELAPNLEMTDCIVDIVTTGNTLRANGLKEYEKLMDVTSRLIVNRTAMKTKKLHELIERFDHAVA